MTNKTTARAAALGMTIFELPAAKTRRGVDLSSRLGWSQSKTSRLKHGERVYTVTDIAMLLAVLDVKGAERQELLAIADSLSEPNSSLPPAMSPISRARFLTCLERVATRLTSYSRSTIPPQLQSTDYVRFLADNNIIPCAYADNLTSRVDALSDSTTPAVHGRFFIGEAALTPADVPPAVTADLLHHLLRLAVRPDIDIRLVPDNITIPDHPTFTHMSFADHPPLVHIDAMNTSTFLEHPRTLDHTRTIITALAALSLTADQSKSQLIRLAIELDKNAFNESVSE